MIFRKSAYVRKMLLIELVLLLSQTCPYCDGATYIKPSKHNKKTPNSILLAGSYKIINTSLIDKKMTFCIRQISFGLVA